MEQTEKNKIAQFVKKWMDGHEPDTFIKNEHGTYLYKAGPVSINIVAYFEELLEDYHEMKEREKWVAYDFMNLDSRPKETGKYFVHRKDGKVHWEQWNGSGWAYNNNAITHWQPLPKSPNEKI